MPSVAIADAVRSLGSALSGGQRMGDVGRMRLMRTDLALAGAMVALLAVGGCGATTATPGASGAGGITATGTALAIDPMTSIDGATRYATDVFGIDVPPGMVASTREAGDQAGTTVLSLTEPGETVPAVNVVFTSEKGATDRTMDVDAVDTELRLRQGGLYTSLKRQPATWDGMAYAVALTGTFQLASDAGDPARDMIMVIVRGPGSTGSVAVSAQAPSGGLTTSPAYAALRTLRFGS